MNSRDVRSKYIAFFKKHGHAHIPSARLVPENDPTTLFNSSGMQPLVPYLLGEPHPEGKRLVNSQKAVRLQDIDEVGDNRHTTFFEMLGNWSLGDYFKKEQLPWIFSFLTDELGLEPDRLYVTVFEGNDSVPKDTESIGIWKEVFAKKGIDAKEGKRIFTYPASKNWWSRSGTPENMPPGEPGGPDSEVFYDFGADLKLHETSQWKDEACHPNCDCGRFMEIANSVFMQYQKQEDGSIKELSQKNVDFGGGLERMVAATGNYADVFLTDMFAESIAILEERSKISYGTDEYTTCAMRIITDHMRAAVMMITDGVYPSNKTQGYVLRRLIRRSLLHGRALGFTDDFSYITDLVAPVVAIYRDAYPDVSAKQSETETVLAQEAARFQKALSKGLREIESVGSLDGHEAFRLYETYGFPWELTAEIAEDRGIRIDRKQFEEEFEKHKEKSRTAAKGMFKGGLADHKEETTKLHTAHHLLLAALQQVVNPTIKQRGSNITGERLRIDVNYDKPFTQGELSAVEALINEKVNEDLEVTRVEMDRETATGIGAQMEFGQKYPDRVSVYFIGLKEGVTPEDATPDDYFSAEFCGGPHVTRTGVIGPISITKEKSAGAGIRRLYAEFSP